MEERISFHLSFSNPSNVLFVLTPSKSQDISTANKGRPIFSLIGQKNKDGVETYENGFPSNSTP